MGKEKNKSLLRKKTNNRTKLDIHAKLIINIIIIVILFFGSISLFMMSCNIDVKDKNVLMTYEEESNITYNVLLKNNPFYPTASLGMNQQYPASLINKINIKYKYDFKTSEKGNYTYRYFTTATIVINKKNDTSSQNSNLLLNKTYQLENEISGKEQNKDKFSIEKTYSINYSDYNNFVTAYKNTYNLSVDSYLKVTMYVEITDTYQDNSVIQNKTMELQIPLAVNTVAITINNQVDKNGVIEKDTNVIESNYFFIVLALIMLILSVLLFIQELKKVLKSDKKQSKYINELNKIISSNSEVIVKVKNKINLKDNNIIEVESMNELLDAQNELRIPIAYFETKRNEEGCFVIVNGKEAWRYILKVKDNK